MPTNTELRRFIVEHFDHGDLDLLIADYFATYQAKEIPGLGLQNRAQNLINYCGKTEQAANLEAALQEQHPQLYANMFGALAVAPVEKQTRNPRMCFISYAHKDTEFAHKLAVDLRAAGTPVWMAPHSIQPGEKWMRAIERGLKECGVFVCVLTPNALESGWVRGETEIAIGYEKKGVMRILPLLVQACDPDELSAWLTTYQFIPFDRRYELGLTVLKNALARETPVSSQSSASLAPSPELPLRSPARRPARRKNAPRDETKSASMSVDDMPMCYVPAGEFIMGGIAYSDEMPEHLQVVEQGFWIGRHTVTNAQFKLFVNSGGYKKHGYWKEAIAAKRWKDGRFLGWNNKWNEGPRQYSEPLGLANHPAVGVSWYEALAFTRWLRERLEIDSFGLPSEAQWEYAARGPRYAPRAMSPLIQAANAIRDVSASTLRVFGLALQSGANSIENRRIYPWGDDADTKKMNIYRTGIRTTSAVGTFPLGVSLFGCEDMSGNVWEWTMTKTTGNYEDYDKKANNRPDGSEARRVLRGGAFYYDDYDARCAFRFEYSPHYGFSAIGFRVIASPVHFRSD